MLTYRAGEELHRLVAGSFIYLPPGVPHAFRVTGTAPVRFVALTAPGGLMGLYDEVDCQRANADCRELTGSRWRRRSGAGTRSLPATASEWSARPFPPRPSGSAGQPAGPQLPLSTAPLEYEAAYYTATDTPTAA
jgi:hypothetical protein